MTKFGSITVRKDHVLASQAPFQMSAYLQELVCLVGQSVVFSEGSMLLEKLAGVQLNAKQIERVSHFYGQQLEEASLDQEQDRAGWREEEVHYGMMDGGHRGAGWF